MIALPAHRKGIHFTRRSDYAFVHKYHVIVSLWRRIKWFTDIEPIPSMRDDFHLKFTKQAVETLCLYFALPSLIRIQRWFRATLQLRRRLAVAMALHPRLGRAPGLGSLEEDLIVQILAHQV